MSACQERVDSVDASRECSARSVAERARWQPALDFAERRVPTRDLYERIVAELSRHYDVAAEAVLGASRSKTVALTRHHAWLRLREDHGRSWPEIGAAAGVDQSSARAGAMRFARVCGLVNWRG